MQCPNCNETLLISERKNVEIDYCPKCRGVWLDKGELDKIIAYVENDAVQTSSKNDINTTPTYSQQKNWKDDDDDYDDRKKYYPSNQKKKSSFLGDLFDF